MDFYNLCRIQAIQLLYNLYSLGSIIQKYNLKYLFLVFVLQKQRVYNSIPVLYSKKKFDVGLDKTVFWLGNVVSFMSVVVCENLKTYIEM